MKMFSFRSAWKRQEKLARVSRLAQQDKVVALYLKRTKCSVSSSFQFRKHVEECPAGSDDFNDQSKRSTQSASNISDFQDPFYVERVDEALVVKHADNSGQGASEHFQEKCKYKVSGLEPGCIWTLQKKKDILNLLSQKLIPYFAETRVSADTGLKSPTRDCIDLYHQNEQFDGIVEEERGIIESEITHHEAGGTETNKLSSSSFQLTSEVVNDNARNIANQFVGNESARVLESEVENEFLRNPEVPFNGDLVIFALIT